MEDVGSMEGVGSQEDTEFTEDQGFMVDVSLAVFPKLFELDVSSRKESDSLGEG